jgi:arginine exporter protein ArgO
MRAVAAIGWSSFLAACLGTMLTFAALDPQLIIDGVYGVYGIEGGEHGAAPWWLTRTGIYSIGFFLFWAVAALAGILTDYLHDSPSRKGGGS